VARHKKTIQVPWRTFTNDLIMRYPRYAWNQLSSLISWFRTDNALYGSMKGCSAAIRHGYWRGRRSEYLTEEETHSILSCFLSRREKHFSLFSVSDYKDTYIGKNLLPGGRDVYLKLYRIKDAPRRIRLRNVLRRCLARKSFVLFYELKKKNVRAVLPLFYVRKQGGWIPEEAIFASAGAGSDRTIKLLLALPLAEEKRKRMLLNLGSYLADLQCKGILYGELYQNLIPVDRGAYWSFILCDLDEMRSIAERRDFRHEKVLRILGQEIGKRGSALLSYFHWGYQRQGEIIHRNKSERKSQRTVRIRAGGS